MATHGTGQQVYFDNNGNSYDAPSWGQLQGWGVDNPNLLGANTTTKSTINFSGPGYPTYTGAPTDTSGWQTKASGYNYDSMPQTQRDYVGQFINGLLNEAPDKARADYLKAQNDLGFSDDLFSKFTSMYGNPGVTGAQIASWKTPAPAPAPTPAPAPPAPPAPAPAPVDNYLGSRLGDGPPQMQAYQKNPYLDDMAAGLVRGANDNWTRNIDPSIRSGAMAAGGFGGSRQGVVESNALNDWSKNLSDSLTNLYGQDYQQTMNRNLQQYLGDQQYDLGLGNLALGNQNSQQNYALGMGNLGLGYYNARNNYDLGLRGNDLGYANLDANIANSNFNNQLSGANFGLSLLDKLFASNQNGTNAAGTVQNTPLTYQQLFAQLANAAGASGSTGTGSTTQQGDVLSSLINSGFLNGLLAKFL